MKITTAIGVSLEYEWDGLEAGPVALRIMGSPTWFSGRKISSPPSTRPDTGLCDSTIAISGIHRNSRARKRPIRSGNSPRGSSGSGARRPANERSRYPAGPRRHLAAVIDTGDQRNDFTR